MKNFYESKFYFCHCFIEFEMSKMDLNKNSSKVHTIESSETLDNSLSIIGFGKFNYIVITLTGIALACVFLETVTINVILPLAQCDLDLSTQDKSMLSSIGFVGIILSSQLWGFLADTKGRKTVIIPTLFIASFLSLASSFAKSFWLLLFLRFLNGVLWVCLVILNYESQFWQMMFVIFVAFLVHQQQSMHL